MSRKKIISFIILYCAVILAICIMYFYIQDEYGNTYRRSSFHGNPEIHPTQAIGTRLCERACPETAYSPTSANETVISANPWTAHG